MINQTKNGFMPDIAIPPGETLQEYLDSLDMTQVDLAKRTGLTPKTINEIIKGKAPITPETALKLESVFVTPASFWNNLESDYQETRARLQAEKDIDDEVKIAKLISYPELARRGFVHPTTKAKEKVVYLRQFFGVASLEYIPDVLDVAFRKHDKEKSSHYALAAWIRMGELLAGKVITQDFNEKKLKETIPTFRELTLHEGDNFMPQLTELCATLGVALVIVPHLPRTYAHGATKWLHPGKAMLQLSTRYQYADIFWFSFFHELGHILLHSKKNVFIETGEKSEEEVEADRFASDCLIPGSKYRSFISKNRFTRDSINQFANEISIDAGIVVGRLQHDKIIPWGNYKDMQTKLV
ncbi:MAG: HigA family addiction module antitoxin [Bacillota bacterium]|nr:HigA family addiction module antitoxin [Bacillota bacterium]MEA1960503.1 HigA family addiction module antitoxin [Bacillota bacterium]